MNRRELIGLAGSALLVAATGTRAQPKPVGRTIRVGLVLSTSLVAEMLGPNPAHPAVRRFLQDMGTIGYREGRNFVLERRSAEGKYDRFEAVIDELLRARPDVIVPVTVDLALAAKKRTSTVPIVFALAGGGDPVASGLVTNLSRPGGNITGVTADAGPEIAGKRLEYLKQAVPGISRVAYLGFVSDWDSAEGRSVRAAAQALGLALFLAEVNPKEYAKAFDAVTAGRADAIFTAGHPVHYANRERLIEFATRQRLPNMHAFHSVVREGALMGYGSEGSVWPQVAQWIDRIVKGAKPGELPVVRPQSFRFSVNLKAARALGIAISQGVLLRADEIIE